MVRQAIASIDMSGLSAILSFSLAAALMTITPGIDTALVLRTAALEHARAAMRAASGIVVGVLAWGMLAALGLGAVLAVSELGYRLLQIAGAAYLLWLGARLLLRAARSMLPSDENTNGDTANPSAGDERGGWFLRGLLTNLLNPKVGVFYVSLLPQFIPPQANVIVFASFLAAIHAALGLIWFAALIRATRPFSRALRTPRVTRALDGVTGAVLIGFGLRLAMAPHGPR